MYGKIISDSFKVVCESSSVMKKPEIKELVNCNGDDIMINFLKITDDTTYHEKTLMYKKLMTAYTDIHGGWELNIDELINIMDFHCKVMEKTIKDEALVRAPVDGMNKSGDLPADAETWGRLMKSYIEKQEKRAKTKQELENGGLLHRESRSTEQKVSDAKTDWKNGIQRMQNPATNTWGAFNWFTPAVTKGGTKKKKSNKKKNTRRKRP